jgi:hypothetical protein
LTAIKLHHASKLRNSTEEASLSVEFFLFLLDDGQMNERNIQQEVINSMYKSSGVVIAWAESLVVIDTEGLCC